jgi:hypothetical protein
MLVETHPKITKLSDNYTYIIPSSYTNFCSNGVIIHQDKGILLLDHYSGVIIFIGIAHELNMFKINKSYIWFAYGDD